MTVSLGFGIPFAAGVTLVLIRCGYVMLVDMHSIFKIIKSKF
jgi:hypothetical protein